MRSFIDSEEGRRLYARHAGIEGTISQGVRSFGLRRYPTRLFRLPVIGTSSYPANLPGHADKRASATIAGGLLAIPLAVFSPVGRFLKVVSTSGGSRAL